MKQSSWLYELECPQCRRQYQLNVRFVQLRCSCKRTLTLDDAASSAPPSGQEAQHVASAARSA